MQWDPSQPRLALVTGGAALYFWTPVGCVIGRIPPVARGNMAGVTHLAWKRKSKVVLLYNKESAVICRYETFLLNYIFSSRGFSYPILIPIIKVRRCIEIFN